MIQTHQPGSGFFPNCPSKSWLMAEDVTVTTCQKSFLKVYFNSFCSSSLGNKSWMCTLIFLYQCDDHFPGRSLYMHIRDAKVVNILPFNTLRQTTVSQNFIKTRYSCASRSAQEQTVSGVFDDPMVPQLSIIGLVPARLHQSSQSSVIK